MTLETLAPARLYCPSWIIWPRARFQWFVLAAPPRRIVDCFVGMN